jgi:DNA-binding transcriptional regulator YiaG
MDGLMNSTAARLLRFRAAHQLSRTQLAKLIGASPRTLERWEQGKVEPPGSVQILLALIEKKHVTVEEVMLLSGDNHSQNRP